MIKDVERKQNRSWEGGGVGENKVFSIHLEVQISMKG